MLLYNYTYYSFIIALRCMYMLQQVWVELFDYFIYCYAPKNVFNYFLRLDMYTYKSLGNIMSIYMHTLYL